MKMSTPHVALLFVLLLPSLNFAAPGDAEGPFAPTANNDVNSIAFQADGKILIGGSFTEVNGEPRNFLARLHPDGSLDTSFDPAPNGSVNKVAVQSDGKILVGGQFNNIASTPRNLVARLEENGDFDDTFVPVLDGEVRDILVDGTGVLVAGDFANVNGDPRAGIARLDLGGALAPGFVNPGAVGSVRALAVLDDGRILAGGFFTQMGGQSRSRLAMLNANGSLDTTFSVGADAQVLGISKGLGGSLFVYGSFDMIGGQSIAKIARINANGSLNTSFNLDPNPGSVVRGVAVQSDGDIVVVGTFVLLGPETRNRVARVSPTGTLDPDFDPDANGNVIGVGVQADGRIVLAGGSGFSQVSGLPRGRLARLFPDGRVEDGFNPGANGSVLSAVPQPDGRIVVGGQFGQLGGEARSALGRLEEDGQLETSFAPPVIAGGGVVAFSTTVQRDGKILVGGNFETVGGGARPNLTRFNANGTLDTEFNPAPDGSVLAIVQQPDGRLLVAGDFANIAGTGRVRLARLEESGAIDGSFVPPAFDDEVRSIALEPGGNILVGGNFNNAGATPRAKLARLTSAGQLALDYNPGASHAVNCLLLQPDGRLLVGGRFTNIAGESRSLFARLLANGTADPGFTPSITGNEVLSLALQTDGAILVAGRFTEVNSTARSHIARIDANGVLDPVFDPAASTNFGDRVNGVAIQADGGVLTVGQFDEIGGFARVNIARLRNDAGTNALVVESRNRVEWLRGGASPEAARVRFELSTDGGNAYTTLGEGVRISGGWELDGLDLPFEGLVRARAWTSGGYFNGSGGIMERVALFSEAVPMRPTLTIRGKKKITTTRSRITLRGTASDPDGDLVSVRYIDSRPKGRRFRSARGLASWSAVAVLKNGRNTVQIQAADATGLKSSVLRLVVIRKGAR